MKKIKDFLISIEDFLELNRDMNMESWWMEGSQIDTHYKYLCK